MHQSHSDCRKIYQCGGQFAKCQYNRPTDESDHGQFFRKVRTIAFKRRSNIYLTNNVLWSPMHNKYRLNAGLDSVIESLNMTGEESMTISRLHFNITLRDVDTASFNATDFNNDNISLPRNLLNNKMQLGPMVRVAQSIFDNPGLYLPRDIGQRRVASSVFGFTVYNYTVKNLTNPLNLTLSQTMVSTSRYSSLLLLLDIILSSQVEGLNRSDVRAINCSFWDPVLDGIMH